MGRVLQLRIPLAAIAFLCAAAATVALWSGPLSSATAGFHGSGVTSVAVHHALSHVAR